MGGGGGVRGSRVRWILIYLSIGPKIVNLAFNGQSFIIFMVSFIKHLKMHTADFYKYIQSTEYQSRFKKKY